MGRVVVGGLVAGLVLNVFDFVVHGVWLKADWEAAMAALNHSDAMGSQAVMVFVVLDFLIGIFGVLGYAAMRPRFGPGPRTAVITGLMMWFAFFLVPNVGFQVMGMFSTKLLWAPAVIALAQLPLAVAAGAYLYKEEEAGVMARG